MRAGWLCEETNAKENLQCAHIISRSYFATRWDFDNAICLSASRHAYYTFRPIEWHRFIDEKFPGRYARLEKRALPYRGWSREELRQLYEAFRDISDRGGGVDFSTLPQQASKLIRRGARDNSGYPDARAGSDIQREGGGL